MVDMEELFRELCVRGRDYITVKDFKKYQYMQMLAEVRTSSCVRACVSSSSSSSNSGRGCLSESLGVRQCFIFWESLYERLFPPSPSPLLPLGIWDIGHTSTPALNNSLH